MSVNVAGRAWHSSLLGVATLVLLAHAPAARATFAPAACDAPFCPERGVEDGSSIITGVALYDEHFGAILDHQAAAERLIGALESERRAIARSLGLPADASGSTIAAALEDKFAEALTDGLEIEFPAPRCVTSAADARAALMACEPLATDAVTMTCGGACRLPAGQASCGPDQLLRCTGVAPQLDCAGTCEGSCELVEPAVCEGICRGTCAGECTVLDALGNCAGQCLGDCQGSCELKTGGSCPGRCGGTCTTEVLGGEGCPAGALAACDPVDLGIECAGDCEGEWKFADLPEECSATVDARLLHRRRCGPIVISSSWQWSAAFADDPVAQAEFRAWLHGFEGRLRAILSARDAVDALLESSYDLIEQSDHFVRVELDALLEYWEDPARDVPIEAERVWECAQGNVDEANNALNATMGRLGDAMFESFSMMEALH